MAVVSDYSHSKLVDFVYEQLNIVQGIICKTFICLLNSPPA